MNFSRGFFLLYLSLFAVISDVLFLFQRFRTIGFLPALCFFAFFISTDESSSDDRIVSSSDHFYQKHSNPYFLYLLPGKSLVPLNFLNLLLFHVKGNKAPFLIISFLRMKELHR